MITGFVGRRGNGKTLFMTIRLRYWYKKGYRIISNYGLKFPHERLDAKRLVEMGEDLHDCAIGVDEMHVLIDSRRSMSDKNRMISYFILQTRKRNVRLFYTTQHEGQVDIRLRRQTDNFVFCKRLKPSTKFVYEIVDGLTGILIDRRLLDGKPFFGLYNTEETITDF